GTLQKTPGAVAGSVALKQAPLWLQSMYADHFIHQPRAFIELLQYCQANEVVNDQLRACVQKLAQQYPRGITAEYVMALLGNQPVQAVAIATEGANDPIVLRSRQNLLEMASLMNYN